MAAALVAACFIPALFVLGSSAAAVAGVGLCFFVFAAYCLRL